MGNISYFESRSGTLSCTAQECFEFATDIRHFERFIPDGTITNWQADTESCSFSVSVIGSVSLRLVSKEMYSNIVFNGDALSKNDFEIVLHITDNNDKSAEVKVALNAELNPMMKMVALKPIGQFLEMLITEMEKFRDWK